MSDVNLATAAGTEQAVFTFSEDDLKKKKGRNHFICQTNVCVLF